MPDTYTLWCAKSQQQLAAEYLTHVPDPDNNAWWAAHWQWRNSEYWRQLCGIHEAIQLLAWEADPPELPFEQEMIFEAVAGLNQHVRTNGRDWQKESLVKRRAYWVKREAIRRAMDAGLVFLRLVEWTGQCRSCNGFGNWDDPYWEIGTPPERCRRCSGTGVVRLSFIECNVADRFRFHQPFDHTNPFRCESVDWLQPHPAGGWTVGRPGVRLPEEQVDEMIAFLKRKLWDGQPGYVKDIYTYMVDGAGVAR